MTKPATSYRDSIILRSLEKWVPKDVVIRLLKQFPELTLEMVYHAKRRWVKRQKDRRKQARLYSDERRKNEAN